MSGTVERGAARMTFVPFARRRYEILTMDVSGKTPAQALRDALPQDTASDLYRVIFTGETDERGVDCRAIAEEFAQDFFYLELRDQTHIRQDIWARAQEDSLRGLFLRELRERYEQAEGEEKTAVERAARFGLAALDRRDL